MQCQLCAVRMQSTVTQSVFWTRVELDNFLLPAYVLVLEEWMSDGPCLCKPPAEEQPFPLRQGSSHNQLSGLLGHDNAVQVVFQPENGVDGLPSILKSAH